MVYCGPHPGLMDINLTLCCGNEVDWWTCHNKCMYWTLVIVVRLSVCVHPNLGFSPQ